MDKAIVAGDGVTIVGEGSIGEIQDMEARKELSKMKKKVAKRARRYADSNIFNRGYRKWKLKRSVKKYKRAKKYLSAIDIE